MAKTYSVVIPTNKEANDIQALLRSLAEQSRAPAEVILVRDTPAHEDALRVYEIAVAIPFGTLKNTKVSVIHEHSNKSFKSGQGVSYVRNFGRSQVTSKYTLFIDDDNIFESSDSIKKLFDYTSSNNTSTTLVAPTQYRSTGGLRPSLAQGFCFSLMRPRRLSKRKVAFANRYFPLRMASSNCLLAKTKIFEDYPFPEAIPFVYEDLVLTSTMTRSGVRLLADTAVKTIHEDDKRSRLAKMYIDTPLRAYQKAKHRLFLIASLQPTPRQKFLYKSFGLAGQTLWLGGHILFFASKSERKSLLQALSKGTKDGFKAKSSLESS